MTNTTNVEMDGFEAEIRGGAKDTRWDEVNVEVKDAVELSNEVRTDVVVKAGASLEYGDINESEDSESDDGLYFENDDGLYFESEDTESDDGGIDLSPWTCDENIISRDEEGRHEVEMVSRTTFAIDVGQEDINDDENDEDIEAYEDLSPPNSGDEETCDQTRMLAIRYDPTCDHSQLHFRSGMRFESHTQFKKAVQKYAITNGYNIGWKKSEFKKMHVKCVTRCEWSLYGSWLNKEKTFVVKTVGEEHTCPRSMRNKNASYIWLAQEFLPKIRANLKYTAAQLQADAMEMWTHAQQENLLQSNC